MPLSTIFQLYRGTQFYWRKTEYLEKTNSKLKKNNIEKMIIIELFVLVFSLYLAF